MNMFAKRAKKNYSNNNISSLHRKDLMGKNMTKLGIGVSYEVRQKNRL